MGGRQDTEGETKRPLIAEMVEDYANPVTCASELMEDGRLDLTKPAYHNRLNNAREDGYLERKKLGRVYAYWPAGKFEGMRARIDELEQERDRLDGVVDHLEGELDELRDELQEAREEAATAEQEAGPRPISEDALFVPSLPTTLPDDLEHRWRVRASSYRLSFLRACALVAFAFFLALGVIVFSDPLVGFLETFGVGSSGADMILALLLVAILVFGWAALWYGGGAAVASVALANRTVAEKFDPLATFLGRLWHNGSSDGD